jgi:hypothetical protein
LAGALVAAAAGALVAAGLGASVGLAGAAVGVAAPPPQAASSDAAAPPNTRPTKLRRETLTRITTSPTLGRAEHD